VLHANESTKCTGDTARPPPDLYTTPPPFPLPRAQVAELRELLAAKDAEVAAHASALEASARTVRQAASGERERGELAVDLDRALAGLEAKETARKRLEEEVATALGRLEASESQKDATREALSAQVVL